MINADLSPQTQELLQAAAILFFMLTPKLQDHLTPEAMQFRRIQELYEYAKVSGTFNEDIARQYIQAIKEMYESYHPELFGNQPKLEKKKRYRFRARI